MKIPDQTMQYKNLGKSGLKVSQLSYGAWVTFGNQLDVKEAKSILQCCRDHGVNFFDNAKVYANGRAEEIMSQAIKELGWKRSDLVTSTKIFWGGSGLLSKHVYIISTKLPQHNSIQIFFQFKFFFTNIDGVTCFVDPIYLLKISTDNESRGQTIKHLWKHFGSESWKHRMFDQSNIYTL